MTKVKTVWCCSSCGHKQTRWSGQCSSCSSWNTIQEEVEFERPKRDSLLPDREKTKPTPLHEIHLKPFERTRTSMQEFDHLLGGGIVPGGLYLIGGEPGIGKSTILLQVANAIALQGKTVLYISGEETLEQIALRAKRLNVTSENLLFLNETNLGSILEAVQRQNPSLLIVDSIQIVYKDEIPSYPGSLVQVRECTATLMQLAKATQIPTFLIGHVTKSGEIAGPKVLEHLVDAVLYFDGDKQQDIRLLRSMKNRYGPTDEIAIFQMRTNGLQEVKNPSHLFIDERSKNRIGASVIATLEGTRPLLVEVQSLVSTTFFPTPSRRSTGIDTNRLALILAVLEKRAKMPLYKHDVFVSATGGITVEEPGADLGIAVAIASSFSNTPLDPLLLVIGEVGLGGEVRPVSRIESRIKEGIQMGFTRCILPKRNLKGAFVQEMQKDIDLCGIDWIDEVVREKAF